MDKSYIFPNVIELLDSLPNDIILDRSTLESFADDKLNLAKN